MLKNQDGFSIVSVLASIALSGVVGMAMMSMMKNSADMYQSSRARESADAIRFIANAVLQNSDACKNSLIGAGIALARIEAKEGVRINRITSANNATVMTAGKKDGPTSMVLEPLKQNRNIASLSDVRYLGQLRMRFDDRKASGFGGGVSDRILPVVLTLDEDKVVGCRVGVDDDALSDGLALGDVPNLSGGCGGEESTPSVAQEAWRAYCKKLTYPQPKKTFDASYVTRGGEKKPYTGQRLSPSRLDDIPESYIFTEVTKIRQRVMAPQFRGPYASLWQCEHDGVIPNGSIVSYPGHGSDNGSSSRTPGFTKFCVNGKNTTINGLE